MEDSINERQPKWNMNLMEDDINGRIKLNLQIANLSLA
jgi:hypothetical protein